MRGINMFLTTAALVVFIFPGQALAGPLEDYEAGGGSNKRTIAFLTNPDCDLLEMTIAGCAGQGSAKAACEKAARAVCTKKPKDPYCYVHGTRHKPPKHECPPGTHEDRKKTYRCVDDEVKPPPPPKHVCDGSGWKVDKKEDCPMWSAFPQDWVKVLTEADKWDPEVADEVKTGNTKRPSLIVCKSCNWDGKLFDAEAEKEHADYVLTPGKECPKEKGFMVRLLDGWFGEDRSPNDWFAFFGIFFGWLFNLIGLIGILRKWSCTAIRNGRECGTENIAFRSNCHRCGEPRPKVVKPKPEQSPISEAPAAAEVADSDPTPAAPLSDVEVDAHAEYDAAEKNLKRSEEQIAEHRAALAATASESEEVMALWDELVAEEGRDNPDDAKIQDLKAKLKEGLTSDEEKATWAKLEVVEGSAASHQKDMDEALRVLNETL